MFPVIRMREVTSFVWNDFIDSITLDWYPSQPRQEFRSFSLNYESSKVSLSFPSMYIIFSFKDLGTVSPAFSCFPYLRRSLTLNNSLCTTLEISTIYLDRHVMYPVNRYFSSAPGRELLKLTPYLFSVET